MNVHVPAPVWKCVECGELFSTWHRRRTHMIGQHPDEWATRYGDCPDCGHVYLSISDTTSHHCSENAGNTSRNIPQKSAARQLAPISEEQESDVGRTWSVGLPKLRPYLPFAQKLRVAPPKHDLWKCITTRSANGQLQDEWLPFQVCGDGIFGDLFAEADDSSE
jgi:DNA-directed RNA polymerase subunit RPC12/RpoP